MKIMKKIMNLPKKLAVLYKRFIEKDTRKTFKSACATLDAYAADVLGIQITEASFAEVKFMYLAYVEHGFTVREILFSACETLFTFVTAYVYIIVNKEDLFLSAAGSMITFLAFFFIAFYFPRRIKTWVSQKSKKNKLIKELTYLAYKNWKK